MFNQQIKYTIYGIKCQKTLKFTLEKLVLYDKMGTVLKKAYYYTGCSIAVVRMHGVHVARVQFPAPRQ